MDNANTQSKEGQFIVRVAADRISWYIDEFYLI